MRTFGNFFMEMDMGVTARAVSDAVRAIRPASVMSALRTLNPSGLDDLITKLEASERVRGVKRLVRSAGGRGPVSEGLLDGLGGALKLAVNGLFSTVVGTVKHVFAPVADGGVSGGPKLRYAAGLMLTFLLAPALLGLGASPSLVAGAPLGWSALWWFLTWFGRTFLLPFAVAGEG